MVFLGESVNNLLRIARGYLEVVNIYSDILVVVRLFSHPDVGVGLAWNKLHLTQDCC